MFSFQAISIGPIWNYQDLFSARVMLIVVLLEVASIEPEPDMSLVSILIRNTSILRFAIAHLPTFLLQSLDAKM